MYVSERKIAPEIIRGWLESEDRDVLRVAKFACEDRDDISPEIIQEWLESENPYVVDAALSAFPNEEDYPWEIERRLCATKGFRRLYVRNKWVMPLEVVREWLRCDNPSVQYAAYIACEQHQEKVPFDIIRRVAKIMDDDGQHFVWSWFCGQERRYGVPLKVIKEWLKDMNPFVRKMAWYAYRKHRKYPIELLLRDMEDEDDLIRVRAVKTYNERYPVTSDMAMRWAEDAYYEVRCEAMRAYEKHYDVLPRVIWRGYRDQSAYVKRIALEALMKRHFSVKKFIEWIRDDGDIGRVAFRIYGERDDVPLSFALEFLHTITLYGEALPLSRPHWRYLAMSVCEKRADAPIEVFLEGLKAKDLNVREIAARGYLERDSSDEAILRMLDHSCYWVRFLAMSQWSTRELSAEVISRGLRDKNYEVQFKALEACRGRDDIPFDTLLGCCLRFEKSGTAREGALRACEGRSDAPWEIFLRGIRDEYTQVRYAALCAYRGRNIPAWVALAARNFVVPNLVYGRTIGGGIVTATIPDTAIIVKLDDDDYSPVGPCVASQADIVSVENSPFGDIAVYADFPFATYVAGERFESELFFGALEGYEWSGPSGFHFYCSEEEARENL